MCDAAVERSVSGLVVHLVQRAAAVRSRAAKSVGVQTLYGRGRGLRVAGGGHALKSAVPRRHPPRTRSALWDATAPRGAVRDSARAPARPNTAVTLLVISVPPSTLPVCDAACRWMRDHHAGLGASWSSGRAGHPSVPYSASVSTPRKHHFVPQFLLRQFADPTQSLVVHRLDPAGRYVANVRDVGHENDAHTRVRRDGTIDRNTLEASMGKVEGDAARSITDLAQGGELTVENKAALAWFAALQWHRSRYLLNSVAHEVGRHDDLTPAEYQTGLLDVIFVPFFSAWRLRFDNDVLLEGPLGCDRFSSVLHGMECLPVPDSLVGAWGPDRLHVWGEAGGAEPLSTRLGRGTESGSDGGDVGRVTLALTPRLGVHIHPKELSSRLTAPAFNRTTVYNARRFVAHSPDWAAGRPSLQVAFRRCPKQAAVVGADFH